MRFAKFFVYYYEDEQYAMIEQFQWAETRTKLIVCVFRFIFILLLVRNIISCYNGIRFGNGSNHGDDWINK